MRKYVLRFVVAAALFVALLLPLSPGAHGADLGTERSVFEFLTTELGLNSAAACGVLANIEAESNFILTSYGDGGTSYGLCQWHDGVLMPCRASACSKAMTTGLWRGS